ncbi:MAG: Fe-S-containing protein [Chloroflexota bacterium]
MAYRPKTVTPQISGTTVSISAEEVGRNGIENFSASSPAGNMPFMAYQLDGKYYVRAAVCVPCGGRSFTLKNGTLICDSCGTVFNASTGIGIRGVSACMSYAKKAAAYTIDGGNIVMSMDDLTTAYRNTLNRK